MDRGLHPSPLAHRALTQLYPPSFADQLARVRALATTGQPLPLDLGLWIVGELERSAAHDFLRLRRDQHLRHAGDLVGGSMNRRAREILTVGARLSRVWHFHKLKPPALGSIHGEVHAARLLGVLPRERRLRTILSQPPWQSAT